MCPSGPVMGISRRCMSLVSLGLVHHITRHPHDFNEAYCNLARAFQQPAAYSPELREYARHPSELVLVQCPPLLSVTARKSVLQSKTRERNGALRSALKFSPPTLAYPLPSQFSDLHGTRGAPKCLPKGHSKVKNRGGRGQRQAGLQFWLFGHIGHHRANEIVLLSRPPVLSLSTSRL